MRRALFAAAALVAVTVAAGCGDSTPCAPSSLCTGSPPPPLCTDTPPAPTSMHLCGAAARAWCRDSVAPIIGNATSVAAAAGQDRDAAKFQALAKRCDDIAGAR